MDIGATLERIRTRLDTGQLVSATHLLDTFGPSTPVEQVTADGIVTTRLHELLTTPASEQAGVAILPGGGAAFLADAGRYWLVTLEDATGTGADDR